MSENNREPNDQNTDGGLFSDNYETPKKENPYLKKNREKAEAKAVSEPPAKPPRAKRVKPAAEESAPSEAEDGRGYKPKRTFSDWMFEHVKIIASIATILVVLTLVLITDVVDIVGDFILQTQQADREEISLKYVEGLAEKSAPITWSDLEKFRRDESKAADSVTWMLPVEGTAYEVWISGIGTTRAPTYVYLYDMNTGDRMVLGQDDFDAFIGTHP